MREFDLDTLPPFRPRWPWVGGDLQTLRNSFVYRTPDFTPFPSERLILPLDDGTGDQLHALIHHPRAQSPHPLVVLIHGLTGSEDSKNIETSALYFLNHGYSVMRLNMRGAGPSAPFCRQFYHAGRSADVAFAVGKIPDRLRARGIVLMGISLGGNVLLKCLAESPDLADVVAAVAVSPPVDLKAAQLNIMRPRNAVYHWHLLRHMKESLISPNARARIDETDTVSRVRSVYEFDDLIVAPANGFDSAEDYYHRSSSGSVLNRITTPTLIIHPQNDPWVPYEALVERTQGLGKNVRIAAPHDGGHIGFHVGG
ncbi:MAG: alpha/beta fold hydrolase, partial [Rhodobacteraceae bacterium]|nr:alpha/beta fold hydrolase [Paracoccaceae bacterium]